MKPKLAQAYMHTAEIFADLSYASRLKVGAIVVKDDRIISIGYNGTPAGWDNNCEDKQFWDPKKESLTIAEAEELYPFTEYSDLDNVIIGRYRLKSKPEVLHAERNALDKLARGHEGGLGATLFVTHGPCLECAKSIYGAGIKKVYFRHHYRDDNGIKFLKNSKIEVVQC